MLTLALLFMSAPFAPPIAQVFATVSVDTGVYLTLNLWWRRRKAARELEEQRERQRHLI